jgi:hypothetical protein
MTKNTAKKAAKKTEEKQAAAAKQMRDQAAANAEAKRKADEVETVAPSKLSSDKGMPVGTFEKKEIKAETEYGEIELTKYVCTFGDKTHMENSKQDAEVWLRGQRVEWRAANRAVPKRKKVVARLTAEHKRLVEIADKYKDALGEGAEQDVRDAAGKVEAALAMLDEKAADETVTDAPAKAAG